MGGKQEGNHSGVWRRIRERNKKEIKGKLKGNKRGLGRGIREPSEGKHSRVVRAE
jgi:hypothetical protein